MLTGGLVASASVWPQQAQRPNIIMFLVDDKREKGGCRQDADLAFPQPVGRNPGDSGRLWSLFVHPERRLSPDIPLGERADGTVQHPSGHLGTEQPGRRYAESGPQTGQGTDGRSEGQRCTASGTESDERTAALSGRLPITRNYLFNL